MNDRIIKYKEKYWSVYCTEILNYKFIWRELSRGEYNKVLKYYVEEQDREEYICKLCLLEPIGFDFLNCEAGVATTLALQIIVTSGFSPSPTGRIQNLMTQYREEMNSFQNQVSCVIHEAFPTLDIEEIENWGTDKTLWYFSRAEYKLSLRGITLSTIQPGQANQAGPQIPGKPGISVNNGDTGDFPELRMEKAFMEGKLKY